MFSVECKNIESLLEFEKKIKGSRIRIDVVAKFKKNNLQCWMCLSFNIVIVISFAK